MAVLDVLVAVDLLLLERPLRQWRVRVREEGDFGLGVDELEVRALGHPLLPVMRVVDPELEVRVALARLVFAVPRRKLGVGWHGRAGDVVREQDGARVDVLELDNVLLTHNAPSSSLGDLLGRQDLPIVVGVVERISRHLLPSAADPPVVVLERIALDVRVQEGLGLLVSDRDNVKVPDLCARARLE